MSYLNRFTKNEIDSVGNQLMIKPNLDFNRNKKIKMLIILEEPIVYYDINKKLDGFFYKIWEYIEEKLKKKNYVFEKKFIKNPVFSKHLEELSQGKYDIICWPYLKTHKMSKIVNFSENIYITKPVIVYNTKYSYLNELSLYVKYLLKIWFYPFAILISLSIIFGYLLHGSDKGRGIVSSLFHTTTAFFGQSGEIVSSSNKSFKSIIASITVIVMVYFFTIYISSVTTAKSVKYLHDNHKLEYSIINEKIMVLEGGLGKEIIKFHHGIPVVVSLKDIGKYKNIINYYLSHQEKASGFYTQFLTEGMVPKGNSHLKTSKFHLGYFNNSLPIHKSQKQLLMDINEELSNFKDKGYIYKTCKRYGISFNTTLC
jgi:hypothetical protein